MRSQLDLVMRAAYDRTGMKNLEPGEFILDYNPEGEEWFGRRKQYVFRKYETGGLSRDPTMVFADGGIYTIRRIPSKTRVRVLSTDIIHLKEALERYKGFPETVKALLRFKPR